MTGLVVIPCGARKTAMPACAAKLYTGPYFTACRRAALALTPAAGWLILSAKHGLLKPEQVIDPYDLRMGQPGSVAAATVVGQARALGVHTATDVVVFAGSAYAEIARAVWPDARFPLRGRGGMGDQMRYLRAIRLRGTL